MLEDLRSARALAVIRVSFPGAQSRPIARDRTRAAIREAIGAFLSLPPASVALESHPGQPPSVRMSGVQIGLSVSHEAKESVAAIRVGGAVGVDIVRSRSDSNLTQHWKTVALDYLGPRARSRIARMPAEDQIASFLRSWTRLEARLKCLGMPLSEWNPALDSMLESCLTVELLGVPDVVGTIAFVPAANIRVNSPATGVFCSQPSNTQPPELKFSAMMAAGCSAAAVAARYGRASAGLRRDRATAATALVCDRGDSARTDLVDVKKAGRG